MSKFFSMQQGQREISADYVIVGAGSSGCVLANRLSENPANQVVLLEAGGQDNYPWIHVPVGYFRTMGHARYDWRYVTEHDPGLNGRALPWPRGKVLGGSSAINGLLYVRGQPEDYDDWETLGNPGWGWCDVLPYFKKSETWHGEPSPWRGTSGPLHVSPSRLERPSVRAWLDAAENLGYPLNPDYNAGDDALDQAGVGYFQQTAYRGRRCSSAVAYLRPTKRRKNLRVETNTLAARIEFDGTRAVAVHTADGRRVVAHKEIILSAGALASPQLLMLSGIGDATHLAEHGIAVQHHLPGVGQGLQDHLQARPVYRTHTSTLNIELQSLWRKAQMVLEYALYRRGLMTMAASLATGFIATPLSPGRPDIQYHIQPWSADHPSEGPHKFSAFTASVLQMRPTSRGYLALQSGNIHDHVKIYPRYLDTELDCQTLLAGMRITRQIARTEPLASLITAEHAPGSVCGDDDDAAMLHWLRSTSTTIYHPTGTCKMGHDPMAVVDHQLKVHGIQQLRIADCSIMPVITSGNTNAPAIMIGEKLSDLLQTTNH